MPNVTRSSSPPPPPYSFSNENPPPYSFSNENPPPYSFSNENPPPYSFSNENPPPPPPPYELSSATQVTLQAQRTIEVSPVAHDDNFGTQLRNLFSSPTCVGNLRFAGGIGGIGSAIGAGLGALLSVTVPGGIPMAIGLTCGASVGFGLGAAGGLISRVDHPYCGRSEDNPMSAEEHSLDAVVITNPFPTPPPPSSPPPPSLPSYEEATSDRSYADLVTEGALPV